MPSRVLGRNPRYLGAKAPRSVDAPAPTESTHAVPARRAWVSFSRLLPACHRHRTTRIPLGNGLGVYDNPGDTRDMMMTQANAKPVVLPVEFSGVVADVSLIFQRLQGVQRQTYRRRDPGAICGKVWQLIQLLQSATTRNTTASGGGTSRVPHQVRPASWLLSGGMTRNLVACHYPERQYPHRRRAPGADAVPHDEPAHAQYRPCAQCPPPMRPGSALVHVPAGPWRAISRGANVTSIETRDGRISGVTYTRDGAVWRVKLPPGPFSSWPCPGAPVRPSVEHTGADGTACNIIKLAPNVGG